MNKNTIFLILLLFIPVSIAGHFLHWGATVIFITAALGIVPLAAYMGQATEEIAEERWAMPTLIFYKDLII